MIVFKAHKERVTGLAFSPDGRLLATYGYDMTVRLWEQDGDAMREVRSFPGYVTAGPVAFSPDGRYLAAGGLRIAVWDLERAGDNPLFAHEVLAATMAFAPAGGLIALTGYLEWGLDRYAVPSGEQLPGGWGGTRTTNRGKRHPSGAVAYHPDGSLVASAFLVEGSRKLNADIDLFDAESGERKGRMHALGRPTQLRYSPDGAHLAALCGATLRVWEVASGAEVAARQVGKKEFRDLAFTPDGTHLVTVSNDKTVRVWETATGGETRAFEWKIGKLLTVAVAPDGCRMAAGSDTGKVVIWDAD